MSMPPADVVLREIVQAPEDHHVTAPVAIAIGPAYYVERLPLP
jgi:hypothetical protein